MKPFLPIVLLCLIGAVGCAPGTGAKAPGPDGTSSASTWKAGRPAAHPEMDASDQFTPCQTCHEDATPDLHEQWFESRHGITNVKCYQCHGTYEDLKVSPAIDSCAACHADRLDHCPGDKACWACHKPHGFKVAAKKEVK